MSAEVQSLTVGEIASTLAGATAVFRRLKIDFCCGGRASLEDAAQSRGVDPAIVRRELDALAQAPPDVPTDSAALCDYIVERYHDVHRRDLPELVRLARRVEGVHRDHTEAPQGLADALDAILAAMIEHMTKEERILFPAMREGYSGSLFGPITVMRHDHDQHGEDLRALESLTHGFQPPDDACNSWRTLYAGLDRFATDLGEHIHLENDILFPRFERAQRSV